MRLKYKKMIIGITMSTMFIGFVTFSLLPSSKGSTAQGKNDNVSAVLNNTSDSADAAASTQPSAEPTKTTGGDAFALKEDAYPAINELVKNYYKASIACDMDTLAGLVTNISHIDEAVLRAKYEFVEGFQNIQCYTIDGPAEGTYRVYVCSDLKLSNIDTLAPGLTGLYITTNENGKLFVNLDVLDEGTQDFMDKADASDAVQKLNATIDAKFQEAVSNDADLKAFSEKLESAAEQNKATPEATDKAK